MKTLFVAPSLLFSLLLSGCARRQELLGDERAAVGKAAKQVGDSARKNAGKTLASARLSGGQIQIGDAQGRPLYGIAAREIQALPSANNGALSGAVALDARATLYQQGRAESGFRADKIQLFKTSTGARLKMTGRVVGTSQNATGAPIEMRAPRADIDVAKRLLVASGGVVTKRGAVTLRAPSLSGQSSLKIMKCADAVVDAPDAQIQAKTATFNWGANHLSAGTVRATRPDLKLTGDHLEADTLASRGTLTGKISATGQNGTARGEHLDFNWKRDHLFAPDATFAGQGATARIAALSTDSKLHVTSADSVRIAQNGALLTARSARGFDKLTRIKGSGIVLTRGELRLDAARAEARDWSGHSAVIVGSGGVTARNPTGTVRAPNATWRGDAQTGHITASGGVSINANGASISGDSASSDARFQDATLSGNVKGTLRDGTKIAARNVEKQGDSYVATGDAGARLTDGTKLNAARVEGRSGSQNAVASGGASGELRDGTTFHAARVEKRGENLVASGGANGVLPDGTKLRAGKVEKRGQSVVATGQVRADVPASPRTRGFGGVEIEAPRVEGTLNGPNWQASGGVVVTTQSGAVVHARRVSLNRATGKLTASGNVTVRDPQRGTLAGDSLNADLNRKSFVLSNGVGQTRSGVVSGKGLF